MMAYSFVLFHPQSRYCYSCSIVVCQACWIERGILGVHRGRNCFSFITAAAVIGLTCGLRSTGLGNIIASECWRASCLGKTDGRTVMKKI